MIASQSSEKLSMRKLLWVGPLTIACAVVANLIIRTLAVSLLGVPESFQLLQAPSIVSSTILFLLIALLAFWLVNRLARRPAHAYRILALVALCVSFLSPIMALTGLLPAPGMNISIFWTMIAMHIVSALIVLGLLPTLTREHA